MSFMILCYIVIAFYAVLFYFDYFFKSCMHYPYFAFLEGTGLQIGLFNLTWKTAAFNRFLYRWSKKFNTFLKKWFTVGYIFTVGIFLPFSLWTLLSCIVNYFTSTVESSSPEVKALVPGINVPISEIRIYVLALIICSVLHELGHVMAAAQDDVPLLLIGFYIFTIMPIAFVQFQTEHLISLPRIRQLKIYCAGVWHNIVTAVIALLLFFSTPIIFSIGFKSDYGVKVTEINYDSPLNGERGLKLNDIITSINGCPITSLNDWYYCLNIAHNPYGICASSEYISENDEIISEIVRENNLVECCRSEDIYSFCFEYMEPKTVVDSALPEQYACLKPRHMIKKRFIKCTQQDDFVCPQKMYCMKPQLHNHTYLLIIERNEGEPIIYMGLPNDLHQMVIVDQYIPKNTFFSNFSPKTFEKFMRYVFMFSMGIGFLNIIPCYGTDGYYIAKIIIQLLGRYFDLSPDCVAKVTVLIIFLGTVITVPILVHLFWKEVSMPI